MRAYHIELEVVAPDDWHPNQMPWHEELRASGAVAARLCGHSNHEFTPQDQHILPPGMDSTAFGEIR